MNITYKTALEIITHEAIVREAYKDSVGVWTWSVGITSASGHDVERYIGRAQPMEHCLEIFAWALEKYADAVRDAFKGHELTEEQFAAALSFHYNTGAIDRATWVTQWKQGRIADARKGIMNWNKPPEIKERRKKERDLFFDGKWSQSGFATEYPEVRDNGSIVWGAAKRVNVEEALRAAMEAQDEPTPDPAIPQPPDVEPVPEPPVKQGFWATIIAAIREYFRKGR